MRKERKETSLENRYEFVNCSRGLNTDDESNDDIFNLVDLRQKSTSEEDDVKYAYDLYTAAKQDFDITMIDHLVRFVWIHFHQDQILSNVSFIL